MPSKDQDEGCVAQKTSRKFQKGVNMLVAIYARTSIANEEQKLKTQLTATREYCGRKGWEVVSEYVDIASGTDLSKRRQWHQLMTRCAKPNPGIEAICMFTLDRAFRSAKHRRDALSIIEMNKIELFSTTGEFDESTA